MKQVRIQCVECHKPVVVSALQACFYCGRTYKEPELDELLQQKKAEIVEVDKLLGDRGISLEPVTPIETTSMPWKKLAYVAVGLFFLIICMVCAILIVRMAVRP
jgi:hypothetical protein